ncbi:hypothetical protein RAJCM14343_1389 [Rhodococcus aetherivorans]|uniref:Uncharacterized protein n=1 Tax=Rhodococcus aetherivorans TaxID=191292 RepID=A0ABQ0YI56_9NOCA|nr:hypothetical protein RAJCM14343_1389 [Rhodococcus aetherivorans]CCW11132.1 hypothetical protein EBESD8_16680 [Rhodococcus aetherivorans]
MTAVAGAMIAAALAAGSTERLPTHGTPVSRSAAGAPTG